MEFTSLGADEALLREIGHRIAQTRLARNLTQGALAHDAGVSRRTIERLESGATATQLSGFLRVCRTLGLLARLDALLPEPAPSPMAQLKLRGRARQRASGRRVAERAPEEWTWGDEEGAAT